jgi:hypothetical protein
MVERELHFTPRAPLLAWRLFRIREDLDGPLLSSPMYHDPDPPPWPAAARRAACHEGHPAPAPGCRCGIYAAIPGTLDSLPGYLLDTDYDADPWAYSEIACSGRVFLDLRGVRVERAEVVRITLAEQCWPDEAALEDVRIALGARYGVPVGSLGEAPSWLSGNLRDQGPPPAEATLDLDTLELPPGRARPPSGIHDGSRPLRR